MTNKCKSTDNKSVREFLVSKYPEVYDKDSYLHSIDSEIEDILHGATGQGGWSKPTSSYKLFNLLKCVDEISIETVGNLLNPKQEALYGNPYGLRVIQVWCQMLRCASKGIAHHLHNNPYKLEDLGEEIDFETTVVLNEYQKAELRAAFVAGDRVLLKNLSVQFGIESPK